MDILAATLTKTVAFCMLMLTTITSYLLGESNTYLKIWLFQTNTQITNTTPLTGLTECDYSGYSRATVASFNGPYVDPNKIAYVTTPEVIFTNNGGGSGNNAYSAALIAQIPGSTPGAGTVTTTGGVVSAPVIGTAGAGYTFAPTVTVAGGGTGAVVTATITAGAITALTLVSGGAGYTDATLVIDPPIQIIAFNNFANPVPLNISTDALPLVCQLNQPS